MDENNVQNENKPRGSRVSLKLAENVGLLDKLSLNSPRPPLSPLAFCNVGNIRDAESGGTPKGIQKRKFLSARGDENFSPGTPKSSYEKGASSFTARNPLVRGRKIGGFRVGSESCVLPTHSFPDFVRKPKIKINDENSVPAANEEMSPAVSDLFCKPLLQMGLTRITEDQDDLGIVKRFPGLTEDFAYESFKRPTSPPIDDCYEFKSKRAKSFHYGNGFQLERGGFLSDDESEQSEHDNSFSSKINSPALSPSSKLNRSQSESGLCIKSAVEKIDSDPTLVGDGSRSFHLPLVAGKHDDLREISPDTLVTLIEGKYQGTIESFKVIDCRYPYEYQGGHIKCAINLHTQRQVYDCFMKSKDKKVGSFHSKCEVLIFHCEFSSQRGPDLCRYLRQLDRMLNESSFPSLHYPELYVLFGGYKSFFEQYKEHCDPQVYLPMVDEKHSGDYRMYKSMSKTDVVQLKKKVHSKHQKKMVRPTMKKFTLDSP